MNQSELKKVFKNHPEIKLAYLFGSRATGKVGPLSDYDFAFYLEEEDSSQRFNIRLELMSELSRVFKTDQIDVVILNDLEGPEFKYNIITEGKLLYDIEPYKVVMEPRILGDYFDFHHSLKKYGLTKA